MKPSEYTIIRSPRRKSVAIVVRPDSSVQIKVPSAMKDAEVNRIAISKKRWISRKLQELTKRDFQPAEHQYREGEPFLYLGNYLPLRYDQGRNDVVIADDALRVSLPPNLSGQQRQLFIREKLFTFYLSEAAHFFRKKAADLATSSGLHPGYVGVKEYRSRWGSCFADDRIYFNWKLIMAPESIIDYVVAHELCHLKEPNHSKSFWRLVEALVPDWKERRKWLRLNGPALEI